MITATMRGRLTGRNGRCDNGVAGGFGFLFRREGGCDGDGIDVCGATG
jgi:hypothetical protein